MNSPSLHGLMLNDTSTYAPFPSPYSLAVPLPFHPSTPTMFHSATSHLSTLAPQNTLTFPPFHPAQVWAARPLQRPRSVPVPCLWLYHHLGGWGDTAGEVGGVTLGLLSVQN